jgi:hypothetical protein
VGAVGGTLRIVWPEDRLESCVIEIVLPSSN